MTPPAEIWVPSGRVDKFPKPKPIPVGEISPSSMATFLNESNPTLEFGPVLIYPAIFSKLRDLPLDEQKKLLVGFYSQGVEAFPNGAELGRFLARINNISWFQPKSPPDRKSLERLCHQALSRLYIPNLTLRIIEEEWWNVSRDATWNVAWETEDEARHAASNVAWEAARHAASSVAWDVAWEAARVAARRGAARRGAARVAALSAEWIVVKDLLHERAYDKGNPLEPLVEIFELGCWPTRFVPDKKTEEEFVVFIPPIQKTA